MVKRLHVAKYKKLENLQVEFVPGVNAISGTNGTCKTSLLHMISNAFQSVKSNDERISDSTALTAVNRLNSQVNAKIERLAKGDKRYNDPAPGHQGPLFDVVYSNGSQLSFRKHNYQVANRYSIKPIYGQGKGESLPALPVVYLSLARLFPWGEFQDDDAVKKSSVKTPEGYADLLSDLYREVTGISADSFVPQKMGNVKYRQDFSTSHDGVDANTISSGEDNVLVLLTALLSLKFYYESLKPEAQAEEVASILLIDEFDATLHPSFQYKLLGIAETFSAKYHIQVIFTTHSLVLLDQMFLKKMNVIYLMDNMKSVSLMPDPDPVKIEMFLKEQTRSQLLADKIIPVFTEDAEARLFADIILQELSSANGFMKMKQDIHFIDANFGAEELVKLFKDPKVRQSSMSAICMLDGDHNGDLSNNTVALPGKDSPEWVAFEYACALADDAGNPFWTDDAVLAEGFSVRNFCMSIKPDIDELRGNRDRKKAKELFKKHEQFFRTVLKAWVLDPSNKNMMTRFAKNAEAAYRKTAGYHGIYISKSNSFVYPTAE